MDKDGDHKEGEWCTGVAFQGRRSITVIIVLLRKGTMTGWLVCSKRKASRSGLLVHQNQVFAHEGIDLDFDLQGLLGVSLFLLLPLLEREGEARPRRGGGRTTARL